MPKILLIEDVASHQYLIGHWLTAHNYEVMVAADGQSGLEMAQQAAETIDLILLDLKLPDIDGWELAGRLKADRRTMRIPIIAVTAYATIQDCQRAIAEGCDDYVSKPIDAASLIEKVRHWTAGA